jgi:hypothetical protein
LKKVDLDIPRLCTAMRHGRKVLERFRVNRRDMVRQYVGAHWSDEGPDEAVPVNLIDLYVQVVSRNLVAKNPRVLLSCFDRDSKPVVKAMMDWANLEIERMCLANTLQRVVLDALFSVGILKVALATPADSANSGWGLPAGSPFAERVDLDDFVFDAHCHDFKEAAFIGHRFRVPLRAVKESKIYSKGRKDLQASEDPRHNEDGDEKIGVLQRGYHSGETDEYEDMVDLWEVYLPRQRVVLTLADDQVTGAMALDDEPLRAQNWFGPDDGPYHVLSYGMVPGNAMPKGPIQNLYDLHNSVNHLYRKLIRQAERQKEILGVDDTEDGDKVGQAIDGEILRLKRPEGLKPASFGAPNAQNFAMADHLAQKFSYQAGNLDSMGGLSPQAKTLGQDRLLSESSSKGIAEMQDATVTFTAKAIKGLCWYWYNDPKRVMPSEYKQRGVKGASLARAVHPKGAVRPDGRPEMLTRSAPFESLDIHVDPYSMMHSTPSSRLQALNGVVSQIVVPMMPLLMQQGIGLDMNSYMEKVGAYLDMPDLADILTIQEPIAQGGGDGGGDAPGMPANTERKYVRENRSMETTAGQSQQLQASMMGVDRGGAGGPKSANSASSAPKSA